MNVFDRMAIALFFWAILWAIPAHVTDRGVETIIGLAVCGTMAFIAASIKAMLGKENV